VYFLFCTLFHDRVTSFSSLVLKKNIIAHKTKRKKFNSIQPKKNIKADSMIISRSFLPIFRYHIQQFVFAFAISLQKRTLSNICFQHIYLPKFQVSTNHLNTYFLNISHTHTTFSLADFTSLAFTPGRANSIQYSTHTAA